jgi:hypothetical protein
VGQHAAIFELRYRKKWCLKDSRNLGVSLREITERFAPQEHTQRERNIISS